MMRDVAAFTTPPVLAAVWFADAMLKSDSISAFVAGRSNSVHPRQLQNEFAGERPIPVSSAPQAPRAAKFAGFGCCFGLAATVVRVATSRVASSRRVVRRAEKGDIEVAEQVETKPLPYFETLPKSIIDKRTLDKLLSTVPKEQWEDPPEDSYLYNLKMYAETYGEGKATKMGWWDFWYMTVNRPDADEFLSGEELAEQTAKVRQILKTGQIPMWIPGPASYWNTGALIQWRGKEYFAGDQVQTPVTNGSFAVQYLNNLAFYRDGLQPWQRGLEIGMAHGYFIIGPFVNLGPLRNTPEAATVGLLSGVALICLVTMGGLLFGSTIKPRYFDNEGEAPATGFGELIRWHCIGGIGGAGFAHALLTVFGSM